MIEAVENHNPEVIVIDEIGRELEALAARTIAERGVQLIGTAHGRTLENLLLNPTLSDLIGGIESVTLSDEEARRRGTQKTVLERRAPPTFDVLIEIKERDYLVIHADVAAAVDAILRGYPPQPEVRYRDEDQQVRIEKPSVPTIPSRVSTQQGTRRGGREAAEPYPQAMRRTRQEDYKPGTAPSIVDEGAYTSANLPRLQSVRVYPYGVARNRLSQAAKRLGVPVQVARDPEEADVLMTLRTYYRNRQQPILMAEARGMPIYVLRANTINQMEQSLAELFNLSAETPVANMDTISAQTRSAIEGVLNGQRWVDLPPANANVRRIQHEMAREAQLVSHSYGKEPHRRVRIFRE
jgi:hypothetical protein